MKKETEQKRPTGHKVRSALDQILVQHIERLIGTGYGIGALPLNIATISCLGLLSERENEIQSLPSVPPQHYTNERFLRDLSQIGLDPGEDLQTTLGDMIQKGYIEVTPDGRFLAGQPTISMIQLLDRLFPEMAGLNLVAYLVQAMDEVLTGRKDLKSATSHLDQTLQMHGIPLSKHATGQHAVRQEPSKRVSTNGKGKGEKPSVRIKRLSEPFRRRQAEKRLERTPEVASRHKILLANGEVGEFEVKDLFPGPPDPGEIAPDPGKEVEAQEPQDSEEGIGPEPEEITTGFPDAGETKGNHSEPVAYAETPPETPEPGFDESDLSGETVSRVTALEDVSSGPAMPLPGSKPVEQETGLLTDTEVNEPDTKGGQAEEAVSTIETEYETGIVSEAHETISADDLDDLIERRIAAFEEDLAMLCPVCTTGKVKAKQTSKGIFFYVCSNKECTFISWGKPYHILCPQCKNPFLVETTDRDGKTILRCPRATCRHRQRLPWQMGDSTSRDRVSISKDVTKSAVISLKPRRKVVRKCLVLRKRKG
jgi:hypothetical protein